jgi:hypothetical protein
MEQDETGTLARLKSLRSEVFEPSMNRFDGRIFNTTGGSAQLEFMFRDSLSGDFTSPGFVPRGNGCA